MASPSPHAHGPVTGGMRFTELPLDVLRMIVSYIPLYPRLRVVSLVRKRLLRAARESITHLPLTRMDIRALRILPRLSTR